MMYGTTKFNRVIKLIRDLDIQSIERFYDHDLSRKAAIDYLTDIGCMSDVESLFSTFKAPWVAITEFAGEYECNPLCSDELDNLYSPEEACEKLLPLAMGKHLRLDQIFTERFLTGFYQDLMVLIGDQKAHEAIFNPTDKNEFYGDMSGLHV